LDSDLKILAIGLGWSTAEAVTLRLVPLWIGARSLEFSWSNIQTAFEANLNLVRIYSIYSDITLYKLIYVALTAMVWIWSRRTLDKRLTPFVMALLVVEAVVLPFTIRYV
jgi:hypothetical protein